MSRPNDRANRGRHWRTLGLLVALALLTSACRVAVDDLTAEGVESGDIAGGIVPGEVITGTDPLEEPPSPPASLPRPLSVADIDCLSDLAVTAGLTAHGQQAFADHARDEAVPTYELAVDVDPTTGGVTGALRATVPAGDRDLNFRVFAGMEAFDASLTIDDVRVDGDAVEARRDRALLVVPRRAASTDRSVVEMSFSYTVAQMAANENIFGALSGDTLQPDQVGLLGRTDSGMQLGHWFPIWLPEGIRTDADPDGFGDIGAFPAASICATIAVPAGYQVVTGGIRLGTTESSIVEGGAGLRDFSMLISDDLAVREAVVDDVTIRVWGPADDATSLTTVLDYAAVSQSALVDAFGPYPWTEVDIVSAPLGGGVGGMEWPGMIWVERSMFAGGIPGMGDLGGLFGGADMDAMLEQIGGPAITTVLEWTVAHELGHEWWHATVGNDSIESPAVDEPLAQFAACIAMQQIHPDNWRDICEAQTTDQFAQAQSLGIEDARAEQPSDAFDSALQYGAVIYGKAPGFYFEVADLIGWQELTDALKAFVADNSFALVSTDALRTHLVEAAGTDGEQVAALWDRWFRDTKGAEDIEPSGMFDGFGGLGGPDGELNLDDLFGNLEGLEGLGLDGELNLDDLFGNLEGLEGFSGLGLDGELNLDDLFGNLEGLEAFEGLDGELNLDDLFGNLEGLEAFEGLDALEGLDEGEFGELLEELFGAAGGN